MSFSSLNFVVEHSSAKDPYLQNGDPDPDLLLIPVSTFLFQKYWFDLWWKRGSRLKQKTDRRLLIAKYFDQLVKWFICRNWCACGNCSSLSFWKWGSGSDSWEKELTRICDIRSRPDVTICRKLDDSAASVTILVVGTVTGSIYVLERYHASLHLSYFACCI